MRGDMRGSAQLGIVCLVTTVLVGCTSAAAGPPDSPEPGGATPTSVDPATSPTPTPTPVAAPELIAPTRPAMETADSETATAIARYFLELYPYVYATGDLTEWKALSHPECVFCASVVTNAEALQVAGQRAEGGMVQIAASSVKEISDRWYSVQLTMTQERSTTIGADGAVVEEFPEEKTYATGVAVLWEDGAWKIREVEPKVADGAP